MNVASPLRDEDLRGRVVILDFWTFCCINCHHVIPELKKLEEVFGDDLLVIGIHCPKFDNEREVSQLEKAIVRHGITHPVANDTDFAIWDRYGARAWPTIVVLDPQGEVAWSRSGEFLAAELFPVVKRLLTDRTETNKPVLEHKLISENTQGRFRFPGLITATSDNCVWVADSGNHRVVQLDAEGKILVSIGSKQPGKSIGDMAALKMTSPQGVVQTADGRIFIADTENGRLLEADLRFRKVLAVAEGLKSPWGLAVVDDGILISLAGSHQIAKYLFRAGQVVLLAGTGQENIHDGAFSEALFSQPSGIKVREEKLWVADSEVSAIRELDPSKGTVSTWVGVGLFDFGHVDGPSEDARLQHALDVDVLDDKDQIIVADTYNHCLRLIDRKEKMVSTVVNADLSLNHPGGILVQADRILVSDTNNHRIVVLDRSDFSVKEIWS